MTSFLTPKKLFSLALLFVLLVVLAGSIVRTTGSGMGCPDWPTCFGHLIPPTSDEQVLWGVNRTFEKGHMTIYQDTLWIAQKRIVTTESFNHQHWEPYLQHDYSTFNVKHTWIEYINRLCGALAGIPALLLLFVCRKNRTHFLLALAGILLLGFEAWLGKIVVDGNLIPGQISMHMLGALLLVMIYTLGWGKTYHRHRIVTQPWLLAWMGLLILQLVFGIMVREGVDTVLKNQTQISPEQVESLPYFIIHRSFIWAWVMSFILYFFLNKKGSKLGLYPVIIWLLLQGGIGLAMQNMGLPHLIQPAHLLLSFLIMVYFTFQLALKKDPLHV